LFLLVGGAGYVTDVSVFNLLRDQVMLGANPIAAKVLAVAAAMVVTYIGNRRLTWRGLASSSRRTEVTLFTVFNLIGLLISLVTLDLSHNVLGLTSRAADNISGNVIGVGLGTLFRFWAYKRYVFTMGEPRMVHADFIPARLRSRSDRPGIRDRHSGGRRLRDLDLAAAPREFES
jgi:putative flippase GtrA